MKISNISLLNFRSHGATTIEAPSGLLAVVGPTGSGKSNAIKALEFLVTGAVHGVSKEDLLRWGATSGHVSGTIETDEDKVEIYRSVSSSTARLYVNGKEFAVGIRDVNAEMLRRFGVDKDVAKFVFTGQGEIDGLLFDPPAQRETAVLKLCGLSDATVVHKALGDCLPLLTGGQNNHELHGQLVALLAETDTSLASLRAAVAASAAQPGDALCDSNAKLRVLACAASAELRTLKARVKEAEEAKATTGKILAMTPAAGGDKADLLTTLSKVEKEGRHRGAKEALAKAQEQHDRLQATAKLGEAELHAATNGLGHEEYRTNAEQLLSMSNEMLRKHDAFDAYSTGLANSETILVDTVNRIAKEPERELLLVAGENGKRAIVRPGPELSAAIIEVERRLTAEAHRLHSETQELNTKLSVLRSASIETRQALLAALGSTTTVECPTCASQVGQAAVPTIQARVASARPEEQALSAEVHAASNRAGDAARYASTLLTALRSVERMAANLGPTPVKIETSRKELTETSAAIRQKLAQLQQLALDVRLANNSTGSAVAALEQARRALEASSEVPELTGLPDAEILKLLKDLPVQIRELERSAEAVAQARRNDDLAAATLAAAGAALGQRATKAASELPVELWNMVTIDAQGTALASWVSIQLRHEEELDKRRKALIGFEAQLSTAEAQRKTLAGKIAAVAAQMAQDAPRQKLVEDITKIRDWFHYGNGPKRVAMGIMSRMTHGVNELLQYMQAPFSVTLHGLEYRVRFLDGRTDALPDGAEAVQLSGGQRVLLSIAVHFARYRMFASKLGILVLDEPTVYLDPASVASVCDALDKVRQLAHKLNMQIWLCTHEPVLLPVCDNVITITGNA